MIKFFRHTRRSMINRNRTNKYLLYAIGEIILVVIGILIALQINNNNELAKTQAKQETYLSLIKNEMESNHISLQGERKLLARVIEDQRTLLQLMREDLMQDSIEEKQLSAILVDAISNDISVNYENGVLTELITSGSLKDIKNDSIRSKLSSWESKIYKIREQEHSLNMYWDKSNDFFEENGTYRTLFDHTTYSEYVELDRLSENESNKLLLKSTEFENILLIKLASSMHLEKGVYPIYQKELVTLIDLIAKELEVK